MVADMDEHRWIQTDDPAIQYGDLPVDDAVARLASRMESGKVKLEYTAGGLEEFICRLTFEEPRGKCRFAVTDLLEKQAFSSRRFPLGRHARFSLMTTSRSVPCRAATFSNWQPLDPKQGVNFYTLDVKRSPQPTFDRRSDCLQCPSGNNHAGHSGHHGYGTSVYPSGDGTPAFRGAAHWLLTSAPHSETAGEDGMSPAPWAPSGTWGPRSRTMPHNPETWTGQAHRTSRAPGRRFDATNYLRQDRATSWR